MFDSECANKWAAIKDDKGGVSWMVFRCSEDGKAVNLVASGGDGWESFKEALCTQEAGLFGGVMRVNAVDNRGSVKSIRVKFVRITVVSAALPAAKRARAAQAKTEFEKFFSGCHLNVDTDEPERPLDKVALARAIIKGSGAHVPNSLIFGNSGDPADEIPIEGGAAMPPQTSSKPAAAAAPEPAPAAAEEPKSPVLPASPEPLAPGAAWGKVQSVADPLNWLLLEYDGKDATKSASIFAMGTGGLDEFKAALPDDKVLFGGIHVTGVDDRGSVKSVRSKLLFVAYAPPNVKASVRAHAGTARGEFQRVLNGFHLALNIESASQLVEKSLEEQLIRNGGAHKCGSYVFTASKHMFGRLASADGAAPAAAVVVAAEPEPAVAVAEAKEPEQPKPATPTTKTVDISSMTPSDAWGKVQSDSDPLNWLLLQYDGKDAATTMSIFAAGTGGLDEFKAAFDDEKVLFGGIRVTGVDDRGSVKSVRSKLLFVGYTPSGVRPTIRAHAGTARGEFQRVLNGFHLALSIESPTELVEKTLEEKLIQIGGAHKVGRYIFEASKHMFRAGGVEVAKEDEKK